MNSIKVDFHKDRVYKFTDSQIRQLRGLVGLYFIFLESTHIPYPIKPSRLIYIGKSESTDNSIEGRLRSHLSEQSGNIGLLNYSKRQSVFFTYLTYDFFKHITPADIFTLENYFISDFGRIFGNYPICNNRCDLEKLNSLTQIPFEIDWSIFC